MQDNYELTKRRTALQFLGYDQEEMIARCRLEHDGEYLYLPFFHRRSRIDRRTGVVYLETEEGLREAGFSEAMTIYDYLCDSKPGCRASGEFATIQAMQAVLTSRIGGGPFESMAGFIEAHPGAYARACEELGGVPAGKGDLAYQFSVLADLAVRLCFWHEDEDFPPSLEIFWDTNAWNYIRFETSYYAVDYLLHELRRRTEQIEGRLE